MICDGGATAKCLSSEGCVSSKPGRDIFSPDFSLRKLNKKSKRQKKKLSQIGFNWNCGEKYKDHGALMADSAVF